MHPLEVLIAFDDAAVMERDGRVNEVAAERPKSRERALLVRALPSSRLRVGASPGSAVQAHANIWTSGSDFRGLDPFQRAASTTLRNST